MLGTGAVSPRSRQSKLGLSPTGSSSRDDDSWRDDRPPQRPVSPSPAPKSCTRLPFHLMGNAGPAFKHSPRPGSGPGSISDYRAARPERIRSLLGTLASFTKENPAPEKLPERTRQKFVPAVQFHNFPSSVFDRLRDTVAQNSDQRRPELNVAPLPHSHPQPCEPTPGDAGSIAQKQRHVSSRHIVSNFPKASPPRSPSPLTDGKPLAEGTEVGRLLPEKWIDSRRVGERIGDLKEPKVSLVF